ncbi:LysR family transcriptional regulator [Rheinheimera sediminis]|uniref:LysR family transcriptional regulator n=1 Tax=Rheinheimera sp. YQF-1 TaxID=2499626 RepID=UPI000FD7D2FC|nr:LysR family transcriptional regulator [Rheinheimera sp. YQF-1]RVT48684.1 LysR family transcriptional regulator [Rheinheimera sp. YQF-1]
MNYPSPRHWLLLDAICRQHSLTKAADRLALSQSAASQALKELEQRLGQPLFLRQGRQLIPTQHTLDLLPKLQIFLDLQQELVNSNPEKGELRLVASETIGCYLLPALLAQFTALNPQINFKLRLCNSSEVIQLMHQQQAQLGFVEGPVLSTEFNIRQWRQDLTVLFGKPELHQHLSVEQLLAQRWIVREQGSGTRAVLEHELARLHWSPENVLELERPEAIKQAVKQGLGIGCLPLLAVQDEVNAGQLMLLKSPLQLQRHFRLVQHKNYQAPLLQKFLDFLQQGNSVIAP